MTAHAKLSPSGSKRWFACPGSLVLEAPIPNKSNTYSDDGTAMHDIAARCLTMHYQATKYIGEDVPVHHEASRNASSSSRTRWPNSCKATSTPCA